jgi:hypothetical protein
MTGVPDMVDDPGQRELIDQGWQCFEQIATVTVDRWAMELIRPVFYCARVPPLLQIHELSGLVLPCVAGR